MCERTARGLHYADAFSRLSGWNVPYIRAGYLLVLAELEQPLGGVKQLNQACPVGCQGMVHGLSAQRGIHLLVFFLRQRGSHAVGGI